MLKWHTRSNGFIWYLQSVSSQSSRIYILLSAHGMFSMIYYMLGHKRSLNKFKKNEIISNTFSYHNAMKLEINHKKNTEKHKKTCKLNNIIKQWIGQQWDQERNQNIPWNKWKWGHKNPKLVWQWESNTKREVYIGSRQSQKTRRSSNKQSNFTLKGT